MLSQYEPHCRNRLASPTPWLMRARLCVSPSVQGRSVTLRCTGVLALSISVPQPGSRSNVQHSTAVMDLLLKPSHCVHKRAAKLALTMTPLEVTHVLWPRGRDWVSHNIRTYKSRFVRRNLVLTWQKRETKSTYPTHSGTMRFLSAAHSGSWISK